MKNPQRIKLLHKWERQGGAMLIGFEMFRNLALVIIARSLCCQVGEISSRRVCLFVRVCVCARACVLRLRAHTHS